MLARAARALAESAPVEQALADLADAAARGAGAEVAVIWLPEGDGVFAARAVSSASAGLAAEVEGLRAESFEGAATIVRARLGGSVEGSTVPFDAAGGAGMIELARRGAPFDADELRIATVAAELAGLAARLDGGVAARPGGDGTLGVVGDALAALASEDAAPARVARLAAIASGGDAAVVWRLRDKALEVAGSYGPIVADEALARAANAVIEERRHGLGRRRDGRSGRDASARPARPRCAPGSLRDRPGAGRARDRAARELRRPRRARAALVRARPRRRARARAQPRAPLRRRRGDLAALALPHARDSDRARRTSPRRGSRRGLPDREGRDRSGGEPRDRGPARGGRRTRSSRRPSQSRHAGSIVEIDAADERLEPVRAQVEESGIGSVLALGSSSATIRSASSPSIRAGGVR